MEMKSNLCMLILMLNYLEMNIIDAPNQGPVTKMHVSIQSEM